MSAPAGWYRDPWAGWPGAERRWNGQHWTAECRVRPKSAKIASASRSPGVQYPAAVDDAVLSALGLVVLLPLAVVYGVFRAMFGGIAFAIRH